MNLRNIFRRTRPTPAPTRLDPHETAVISAWGFTEQEWMDLNSFEREHARTNYTKAPRYIK